jgi:ABC-2 type transport system permease protein
MTITFEVMIPVIFITILLMMGLYGISLMLSAFSLKYKQSYDLSQTIGYVFYILAPIRYPVESLPSWAQIFSKLIPLTYALIIVRSFMLLGSDISAVYLEVIALIIIDAILLLAGFYLFNWMEEKTRKSGTISHH